MRRISFLITLTVALLATFVSTVWAAPLSPSDAPPAISLTHSADLTAAGQISGTTAITTTAGTGGAAAGSLDKLSEVLGALGLFSALMVVLALGTEVMIDALKFFVGLKSKPTSLDALNTFADELPGQLDGLGLSNESMDKVKQLAADIQVALKPIQPAQQITQKVRDGDLRGAFDLLNSSDMTVVKQSLDTGLSTLITRLGVSPEQTQSLVKKALILVGNPTPQQAEAQILNSLQQVAPLIVQTWAEGNTQAVATGGRTALLQRFNQEVVPDLEKLGLNDQAIQALRGQLDTTINQLSTQSTVYLQSVRNLMQAVKNRRNDMQSPLRKFWRKLREYKWIGYGIMTPPVRGFPQGYGILTAFEGVYNWLTHRQPAEDKVGEAEAVPTLTATSLASYLLETDSQHHDEEASRLRVLRIIAVLVGTYLAFILNLDALKILAGAGGSSFTFLDKINFMIRIPGGIELPAGIILSGLAASAGSAFWHDQLEKLQVAKKATTQVKQITQTLQQAAEE